MNFSDFIAGFREKFGPRGDIEVVLRDPADGAPSILIRWDDGFGVNALHATEMHDAERVRQRGLTMCELGREFAARLSAELNLPPAAA